MTAASLSTPSIHPTQSILRSLPSQVPWTHRNRHTLDLLGSALPNENTSIRLWWEEYPDRLASEFESLENHDISYSQDAEAFAQGILRLHLHFNLDGNPLHLIASFPDSYPYFPFEVAAPDLNLSHHQHARAKVLCLLPRSTQWWRPATDRLGDFIHERLPLVLQLGSADDEHFAANGGSPQEERQAEPYSDYYSYEPDSLLFTDSGWDIPEDQNSGFLTIGVYPPPPSQHPPNLLNGALLEVQDENKRPIVKAPVELTSRYKAILQGRWVRCNEPLPANLSPEEIFRRARSTDLESRPLKTNTVDKGALRIMGVLYPEERRWRGSGKDSSGDAWLIAAEFLPSAYKKSKNRTRQQSLFYLVRPGVGGPADLQARTPELSPLAAHQVAIFGLGCIGAPSALEFARAGIGGLRLIDRDYVDPSTVVRWPLGLRFAGRLKVNALAEFLDSNYPYTRLDGITMILGGVRNNDGPPEQNVLARMLDGASLLYDATAEYGVQRFLADQAMERSIPYIGVQATAGGWGGLIVRIIPNHTEGCWICLQLARESGEEVAETFRIPNPPADPKGDQLQPAGCANPTFTAANFDTMEVALSGVRSAVSTLCAGRAGAYPEIDWDVAILSLRNEQGHPIAPSWKTFRLRKHPECRACAARE